MKFTGKDGTMRIYERQGGYMEVSFKNMDFSGPIGRPKLEETLVLDRGQANCLSHYINGSDAVLFDPVPITFSFVVETTSGVHNIPNVDGMYGSVVIEALKCRDGALANCVGNTWAGYGSSTKGFYQNIFGTDNPRFEAVARNDLFRIGTVTTSVYNNPYTRVTDDAAGALGTNQASDMILRMTSGAAANKTFYVMEGGPSGANQYYDIEGDQSATIQAGDTYELYDNMRCVDIEIKFDSLAGLPITWVYREVYFPMIEQSLAEAEDSITISASGGVYGPIGRYSDWVAPLT